jgi:hypothetical protein
MKEAIRTNQARIDANNEKFGVLRGTLVFRIDIPQARQSSLKKK